jgi:hypothetical protein
MRAIVYQGPGIVALRDVPPPQLENPGDALVRVDLAGICGTICTSLLAISLAFSQEQLSATIRRRGDCPRQRRY